MTTTQKYFEIIKEFISRNLSIADDSLSMNAILLVGVGICAVVGYYLAIIILRGIAVIVEKTETDWDDDLISRPLLKAFSQLAPALIIDHLLPYCFVNIGTFGATLNILTDFYIIIVTVYAANIFLDNLFLAFSKRKKFKPFAVKGIFQMGKLIFIGIGVIIGISLLVGKSPVAILTALGASAAILMLVFKDTIMGLVASVQLTANKMLQKGDWIIVPKHNANGEVIDISLTTVKIRNWDNSITTVPPYSLVSDSFQNFQAMRRAGARRVCRPVYVDINTIRFLSEEELSKLEKEGLISERPQEPSANITLFRNYLEGWLAAHPEVRDDLLYMVRQLEPTQSGLPVELYFFLSVVEWKAFEHLQSSIFDHVYAAAPHFGLTLFQSPTGRDILTLSGKH